jgi:transglutaminase-like putative cysteine protease
MRLNIRHVTRYRYSTPARYTIQYLRLTPRTDVTQDILNWSLKTPGRLTQQIDGYGNVLHIMVVDQPYDEVEITAQGVVISHDSAGIEPYTDERFPLALHLRPTALTEPTATVRDFAAPLRQAIAGDRLAGLHELSRATAAAVRYRPGTTEVDTSASEALAAGNGVCQDQAHVFTAAARYLGVPTRYVSGYVHVADDAGDDTDTHAWAEAWVDNLGWVSFDITNAICPTDAHVRVAVGPDYTACAPVRGIRQGGGMERMDIKVAVAATDQ